MRNKLLCWLTGHGWRERTVDLPEHANRPMHQIDVIVCYDCGASHARRLRPYGFKTPKQRAIELDVWQQMAPQMKRPMWNTVPLHDGLHEFRGMCGYLECLLWADVERTLIHEGELDVETFGT